MARETSIQFSAVPWPRSPGERKFAIGAHPGSLMLRCERSEPRSTQSCSGAFWTILRGRSDFVGAAPQDEGEDKSRRQTVV